MIPTRFKLFNQTITVTFPAEPFIERVGVCGFASYRLNQIQLCASTPTAPRTQEQLEQAFYHELTHFILYHAGAAYSGKTEYMHQDEGFVDLCASLLHQAMTTAEFD